MRVDRVGPALPVDFDGARHPVMAIACPSCGAGINAYCKRPSGHQGPLVGFHAARRALAAQRLAALAGQPAATGKVGASAAGAATVPEKPDEAETNRGARLKWTL